MPSPFPGMDPYIEQDGQWRDFHNRILPRMAAQLTPLVRPEYIVTLGQDVYLHELSYSDRRFGGVPDVAVTRHADAGGERAAAVAAPSPSVRGRVAMDVDKEELSLIEIRDRHSRNVVTVIEVLSPTNKYAGPDREQYLRKRLSFLTSPAHFLEIDLLRGGPRMPYEGLPPCDYVVMLSRAEARPEVELFPVNLRQRLPIVPVPLRTPHADVTLDVQAAVDAAYDEAGYVDFLYDGRPEPALRGEDREWAAGIAAGVRDRST